ncbi:Uncharacterised protein [Candidatus Burarchaeum australiense]|nr:Uncharacterised protein [Candidatus Burarchaeum australiense]
MTCMKKDLGGKRFFGSVLVGSKGQAVIPEEARRLHGVKAGDRMLVFGGPGGAIVFVKEDVLRKFAERLMKRVAGMTKAKKA